MAQHVYITKSLIRSFSIPEQSGGKRNKYANHRGKTFTVKAFGKSGINIVQYSPLYFIGSFCQSVAIHCMVG